VLEKIGVLKLEEGLDKGEGGQTGAMNTEHSYGGMGQKI
jgi:hypothetical protein